ncbi:MAG: hypothetical protein V4731_07140 [Pseudomonadota bacterium]
MKLNQYRRKTGPRNSGQGANPTASDKPSSEDSKNSCWPFPPGSQNDNDRAVKVKPLVPASRNFNHY